MRRARPRAARSDCRSGNRWTARRSTRTLCDKTRSHRTAPHRIDPLTQSTTGTATSTFRVAGQIAADAAVHEVDDAVQILRVEVQGRLEPVRVRLIGTGAAAAAAGTGGSGAGGARAIGEPVEAGAQQVERVGGGEPQVVHRLERRPEKHCERLFEPRRRRLRLENCNGRR